MSISPEKRYDITFWFKEELNSISKAQKQQVGLTMLASSSVHKCVRSVSCIKLF